MERIRDKNNDKVPVIVDNEIDILTQIMLRDRERLKRALQLFQEVVEPTDVDKAIATYNVLLENHNDILRVIRDREKREQKEIKGEI